MDKMVSPEQFVKTFGPALQEYLEYQYRKEGHMLDLLAASGEFFTVSFHSVSAAISTLQYTESTTSKTRTTSKK